MRPNEERCAEKLCNCSSDDSRPCKCPMLHISAPPGLTSDLGTPCILKLDSAMPAKADLVQGHFAEM